MYVVTGANGFIGSALVWELNNQGQTEILCVDSVPVEERQGPLQKRSYNQFVHTDNFLEFAQKTEVLKKCRAVFHMGACSSTTEMDRDFLRKNNTEYSQSIFQICTEQNVPLIYASSAATYGDGQNGFDDETPSDQLKALNPYGESKLNFDIWAEQQNETPSRWYGLKFFNVYGPNEYHKGEMCSVAYKAFDQIKEKGQLKLFKSEHSEYKDGEQKRDFIYVKDVTRWMLELLKNESAKNGIYNMGSGQARTWLDLAQAGFDAFEKDLKIDWIDLPKRLKGQYQYFTEAKMDKWYRQNLSKPEWPLEKGVEDYYKKYLMTSDPYL